MKKFLHRKVQRTCGRDNDKIFGEGSEGSLNIGGNPVFTLPQYHGADTLYGGAGNDSLTGDGAADELYGEEGDDLLIGDEQNLAEEWHGADYLDGGDGNDTMTGGVGKHMILAANDDRYKQQYERRVA